MFVKIKKSTFFFTALIISIIILSSSANIWESFIIDKLNTMVRSKNNDDYLNIILLK